MTMLSINPATGEEIARFPEASWKEIDEALALADHQFREWRATSFSARAELVRRVGALVRENRDELADLAITEMGKVLTEARAEVEKSAGFCDYYAERAEEFLAPQQIEGGQIENWVAYEPLGPVLAVMPWNFPFVQVFRFAPSLLMAGNTVILKHAPNVSLCALRIAELFAEAGFPDGAFQTLLASQDDVGRIVADDRVRAVTLTGSERAGSAVAAAAGKAIKPVVLELGGSDPFIVLEDADIPFTAAAAVRSRFFNSGQSCINAKRILVLESIAEEFEAALVAETEALRFGDPTDERSQVGPLAGERFVEALRGQVQESVEAGARLRCGGFEDSAPGAFVRPMVLTGVTKRMRAFREETFGPVATVTRVADEDEAIALANDSDFGLGASIWSRDLERARGLAPRVAAGMVFINEVVASDVRLPFGGVKRSGIGRELGRWGMLEFVQMKSIAVAAQPAPADSAPAA
jgi:succinate-semialdehyde dehydrogenase / glutarate-semialdehyde dehydrogenase